MVRVAVGTDRLSRRLVDAEVEAQAGTRRTMPERRVRHVSGTRVAMVATIVLRMPRVEAGEGRPRQVRRGVLGRLVRLQARAARDSRHPLADRRSHTAEAVVAAQARQPRVRREERAEAEPAVEHQPRRQVEQQTRAVEAVANGQRPQRQVPAAPVS